MIKKMLGILVMTLFIASAFIPLANSLNIENNNNGDWIEQAKLVASDGENTDFFGNAISIDGEYAIIGAIKSDESIVDAGSAYIFKRSGATWTQQQKLTPSEGLGIYFGISVSIDGDYAVVGASHYQLGSNPQTPGLAYVFKRSGDNWIEQQTLIASDADYHEKFGWSVSIDEEYILVGASLDDDNGVRSGSAYIFKRSGATWTEQQKLTASDGASYDSFGESVSIDGEYAVIGAIGNDDNGADSGSAYIFKRSGATWTEEAKLTPSDGASHQFYGHSVSIDEDNALIGAYYDDDNGVRSGSAYIFKNTGTTWTEQQKLTASDGTSNDNFGESVSIDGEYAIIGAYRDDDNGADSGSAYIFKRTGTTWTEQQKLTASDGVYFGCSVSLDGDYAVVGSYYDNYKGSAYIFINNENNPPDTPSPLSGPSSGKVGDTLDFTTSTTDPDDDNIYYGLEEDGDNIADWWTTNSYPSGSTVTIHITFNSEGTYNLRVQAKDINDALSGFSTIKTVTISSNNEPVQPDTPSGPTSGTIGESYSYSTSATDPDGDQIKYGFDWDGDGVVDDWTQLYNSGSSCQMSHTWVSPGTYNIKVKARDEQEAESIWSPTLTVVISGENNPPNAPSTSYDKADDELIITATDPDDDQVRYGVSWKNNGIVDQWTVLVNSGTEKRIDCGGRKGTVGVIAEDENGAQSEWVSQKSKIKQKTIETPLFAKFLENYPIIYKLFQQFFNI